MRLSPDQAFLCADLGGTHARFAIARWSTDGLHLDHVETLEAAAHPGIEAAIESYLAMTGIPLPTSMTMAVATHVSGDELRLTNNPWVIRLSTLRAALDLADLVVVNDFAAIGHCIAHAGADRLQHVCGPERGLPEQGLVSIVGPGTGLGVAQVLRTPDAVHVLATEGGHLDFAPTDETEDRVLEALRRVYGRVSTERILSGPGLFNLYRALGHVKGVEITPVEAKTLWSRAIAGTDPLAAEALMLFCLILGSVCGDLALAHGSQALVLAGGLVPRIETQLRASGFHARFTAKGRFEAYMREVPVYRTLEPEPGLMGAALAFAARL